MDIFPTLFSSFRVGQRTLKNRFVITAHATSFDKDGLYDDDHVRYWVRRAQGGAGLVICNGAALVHRPMGHFGGRVSLWDPANEPYLRAIADGAHEHGALVLSQATHRGRAHGHRLLGSSDVPMEAPSAVPQVNGEYPRVLTADEIQSVVDSFVDVATRLERCGWDGIEITSFGDHLMQQFWSPLTNLRDDQYGGTFENRMRFSLDVFRGVREAVGPGFIIACRIGGDPLDGHIGLSADDMQAIAQRLDSEQVIDLFDVGAGTTRYDTVAPDTQPVATFLPIARRFKEFLSVPVLYAGRILTVDAAESALISGDVDLIAMTRATIADPDLPRKAERGEVDRIRPCIALVDACIGRTHQGVGGSDLPIRCGVNPAVGYPELDEYRPADTPRRVVVAGGGPSGLEAARVAAERGHAVTLYEARRELGGQVQIAARAKYRPHFGRHITWLERELQRLGVDVRLGQPFSRAALAEVNPDAVIVATGARTVLPEEVDCIGVLCATDVDVYDGTVEFTPEMRVTIYDREGRIRGGMMAVLASEAGAEVTFATSWRAPMDDLDMVQQPFFLRRFARMGITVLPNRELVGTRPGVVVVRDLWAEADQEIKTDLALFIGYRSSETALSDELRSAHAAVQLLSAGDCVAPRRYRNATREGALAGNTV